MFDLQLYDQCARPHVSRLFLFHYYNIPCVIEKLLLDSDCLASTNPSRVEEQVAVEVDDYHKGPIQVARLLTLFDFLLLMLARQNKNKPVANLLGNR